MMRAASARVLGPHQRRALARQRQDRERTRGQKMLFGAAVMIALMADGDDDAGLIVLPAMGGDAGALAQFRARAVGGDQQARLDRRCRRRASRRRRRRARRKPSTAVARRSMPSASARATSASIRWRFSTMCANGSPGSTSPAKVRNTGRVASSSLESVTTMSRIGCASAATSSQTPIASNSRRQAATMAVARGSRLGRVAERRIGDDDRNIGPEPLAQRQRQRQPGKRAAADDNASLCRHADTRLHSYALAT